MRLFLAEIEDYCPVVNIIVGNIRQPGSFQIFFLKPDPLFSIIRHWKHLGFFVLLNLGMNQKGMRRSQNLREWINRRSECPNIHFYLGQPAKRGPNI